MNEKIKELVVKAQHIVVIQADNPDADSLGSALALEQILGEMGKNVWLYCGINIPEYLQYMSGYSRVNDTIPTKFDLSIIVDTSAQTLRKKLEESGQQGWVASRPCIIMDHHVSSQDDINYATVTLNEPSKSSTGELIYNLARQLDWPLDTIAAEHLLLAILGDTQGLSNTQTSAATYRAVADLIDLGVNRPKLEELRREASKMDPTIFKYKAELIERTELLLDGKVATVTVPQSEINQYSPLYNPKVLIVGDMLMTKGVAVALIFKQYDDGKILCAIRCNTDYPIAATVAQHFGGGGHAYASGFKLQDNRPLNEVKSECIEVISDLLTKIKQE